MLQFDQPTNDRDSSDVSAIDLMLRFDDGWRGFAAS